VGDRSGKSFKCPSCGHVENADVNASFNIAVRQAGVSRSTVDRDAVEGSTDTPREATAGTMQTLEPHVLQPWEYVRIQSRLNKQVKC
jgi:putative transposase